MDGRKEIVRLKENIKAIHKYNPKYIFLTETSSIPTGFALKEAWKEAYPLEKPPIFYRIDPSQIMQYDPKNPSGKKMTPQIRKDLEDFFKKRIKDRNSLILVYDADSMSGKSPYAIVDLLKNPLKYGLSEDIRHYNIKMNCYHSYPQGDASRDTLKEITGVELSGISGHTITTKNRQIDQKISDEHTGKDFNFRGTIVRGKISDLWYVPKNANVKKPYDVVKLVKAIGREAGQELHTELEKKKKSLEQKVLGLALMVIGLLTFFLQPIGSLTGFAVAENIASSAGAWIYILGLGIMLVGVMILQTETIDDVLRKVDIYSRPKKKSQGKGEAYEPLNQDNIKMSDPKLYFSKVGEVSLREFRREIRDFKDDPELMDTFKREYGARLIDKIQEAEYTKDKTKNRIGKLFYRALYKQPYGAEEKEGPLLSKGDAKRITNAFTSWDGSPDSAQSNILSEFNLVYRAKSGHGEICSQDYPEIKISVSSTPSSQNAGRAIAGDLKNLVKIVEEKKKKEES